MFWLRSYMFLHSVIFQQ